MLGLNLALSLWTSIKSWLPSAWFTNNEQGVWYDPSDFSTMFQDSAGTTPVTAVEQPVGKILDKSGRGNHATQATSTKRPVLSARVNLLTKTEDFDAAVWLKLNAGTGAVPTVTTNYAAAPDGTMTAARLQFDLGATPATAISRLYQGSGSTAATNRNVIWARTTDGSTKTIYMTGGNSDANLLVVDGTWQLLEPPVTTSSAYAQIQIGLNGTLAVSTSADLLIWHPQVETGSTATRYQRVNTATDYDTVGFKHYLKFDGVDDALSTGSIDFTATDKMTVVAGVRKLSDAAYGVIAELSNNWFTGYNGAFALASRPSVATYEFGSRGTTSVSVITSANFAAPITNVLTGSSSISTDVAILRVNGTQAAQNYGDQGTGNYGNYPLYIGSRGGTSLPFNGHLYSLIIRGAQSTDAQITSAERFVASKTGVTL